MLNAFRYKCFPTAISHLDSLALATNIPGHIGAVFDSKFIGNGNTPAVVLCFVDEGMVAGNIYTGTKSCPRSIPSLLLRAEFDDSEF